MTAPRKTPRRRAPGWTAIARALVVKYLEAHGGAEDGFTFEWREAALVEQIANELRRAAKRGR